jgi:hypothetical protein
MHTLLRMYKLKSCLKDSLPLMGRRLHYGERSGSEDMPPNLGVQRTRRPALSCFAGIVPARR